MRIFIKGHEFNYELEKLTRLFFPFERVDFVKDGEVRDGLFGLAYIENKGDDLLLSAGAGTGERFYEKTKTLNKSDLLHPMKERYPEHVLAGLLFECYCLLTNYRPQWGILTGIRPAKLFRKMEELLGEEAAFSYFVDVFKVEKQKLSLLKRTAKSEDEIISRSHKKSVSIYVSIPFCPTRCSYCSFVSHSISSAADLIPSYLEFLIKELEETANIINRLGLEVMTVYVGGGTPTTLSAEQLELLLGKIRELFGYNLEEFTVEAGRPDTITTEKLLAIKNAGVDRISINPQSMNNEVLKKVGRRHTANDVREKLLLAKEMGFDNINMDLIAGLPGDTPQSFKKTLNEVLELDPESITVHSLSIKRSAEIRDGNIPSFNNYLEAGEMVSYAEKTLTENKIFPYYMYRQSKTVGNLENVGYAKSGKVGIYNVYIMDETHTILACGASAVSKLKDQESGNIERIFNFKYPYEYINGFDEILKRKRLVEEFYAKYHAGN